MLVANAKVWSNLIIKNTTIEEDQNYHILHLCRFKDNNLCRIVMCSKRIYFGDCPKFTKETKITLTQTQLNPVYQLGNYHEEQVQTSLLVVDSIHEYNLNYRCVCDINKYLEDESDYNYYDEFVNDYWISYGVPKNIHVMIKNNLCVSNKQILNCLLMQKVIGVIDVENYIIRLTLELVRLDTRQYKTLSL